MYSGLKHDQSFFSMHIPLDTNGDFNQVVPSHQISWRELLPAIITLFVVAGGAFYAGMQYAPNETIIATQPTPTVTPTLIVSTPSPSVSPVPSVTVVTVRNTVAPTPLVPPLVKSIPYPSVAIDLRPRPDGSALTQIGYTIPDTWNAEFRDDALMLAPKELGGLLGIRVYNYPSNAAGRRAFFCTLHDYCTEYTYFTPMQIGNISGYRASSLDNSGGGAMYFGSKGSKFYSISSVSPSSPNNFDSARSAVLGSLVF